MSRWPRRPGRGSPSSRAGENQRRRPAMDRVMTSPSAAGNCKGRSPPVWTCLAGRQAGETKLDSPPFPLHVFFPVRRCARRG